MKGLIMLIIIIIVYGFLWALPLYICGNFVLWCFNIEIHLTIFQSIALTMLASVIKNLLFKKGE